MSAIPKEKVCSRCGQCKPASSFTMRSDKRALKSHCRACLSEAYRLKQIPQTKRLHRSVWPCEPKNGIARLSIPGERLIPLVEQWLLEHPHAARSENITRTLNRLRCGEQNTVKFDAADRLLIELGLEHHWHGSLADLYEREIAA